MKDFINESELTFKDISTEQWRDYIFESGFTITINLPLRLNVSSSGGHRVFDSDGISHYIPAGWKHLKWKSKEGQPNFIL